MGLHRAGFDVVGVDIEPQPNHPGVCQFVQADALTYPLDGFDFIWASPPCQAFTAYKRRPNHVAPRPNLIPAMRDRLRASDLPFVIENVPTAPLLDPIILCGSMFGLDVKRHRLFELNFPILVPECDHGRWTRRFKPASNRTALRYTIEIGAYDEPLPRQYAAIGIDWMTRQELSQAVPPAYAEHIGRAALAHINQTQAVG